MSRIACVGILLLAAISFSQGATPEELCQTDSSQHSAIANPQSGGITNSTASLDAAKPIANFSATDDILILRRNARFYYWRGECYTQDRDENWYQVDARLC